MAAIPPVCDFNRPAPNFTLKATNGRSYNYSDIAGQKGTLIMFICNHCPFVLKVIDRITREASELQLYGIGVAAICSNDPISYPSDSFENMATMAIERKFSFPYLHDADQSVAREYDAICTPDFFGFNAEGKLQYRGRLDASRSEADPADVDRDLFEAMKLISATGQGPRDQIPSMGCSIKWKAA